MDAVFCGHEVLCKSRAAQIYPTRPKKHDLDTRSTDDLNQGAVGNLLRNI